MTAGASLLDLIGERTSSERAPAVRAFAEAFLRRLSADGGADGLDADALCGAIVGAFEFASARGAEPIAVRAFTPTIEEHGYELPGSVVETNTEDWPFLVDSVSAELRARGLGIHRVLHPIVGVERDADGAIDAVLHPREASRRESVMHFELERRLTDEQLGGVEEALRRVLSDVRATVKDFPAMADRARRMVQLAGAGAGALRRRGGRRDRRLPRVAAARQLHLPRLPRVPDPRGRDLRSCRTPASGSSPARGSPRTRSRRRSSRCRPGCASGRSRATC